MIYSDEEAVSPMFADDLDQDASTDENSSESLPSELFTSTETEDDSVQVDDSAEQDSGEVVAEEELDEESEFTAGVDEEVEEEAEGFRGLGLSEGMIAELTRSGYTVPTPIQAQTIPLLLAGRDVLGQAQTGTGKTAAFALPLLHHIDVRSKTPQILVLAPTRELAIQVAESFEKYGKSLRGLRVASIYGGQDYQVQLRQLSRGIHVVVGTPGRIMDHMRRGTLNLQGIRCMVLDEADEMLRMGFAEDVDWILTQAPAKRQMALFSATMPSQIRQIAQQHLKHPAEITIEQKTATADNIRQRYLVIHPQQKMAALARILEAEPTDGVLVFVKMRSTTEPVAEYLAKAGLKTAALNGDVAQKQRERIVEGLRSGRIDVIVATDVAARGLDVQRISHVVNYDPPHNSETYVHRIGRTGRAGRSGDAILFIHPRERYTIKRLEYAMRHPIEAMDIPSNRAINKQRVTRFHERITQALKSSEIETFQSVIEQYQKEHEVPVDKIAAALAILANGSTSLLVKDNFKLIPSGNSRDEQRAGGGSRNDRFDRERPSRPGDRQDGDQYPNEGSGDRARREPRSRRGERDQAVMETYRIEVGRNHQVLPGNIVGAIANEAGIRRDAIGKITIYDHFSTIDLANDIPTDSLDVIKQVMVSGRKLQLTPWDDATPRPARPSRPPFQGGKRPFNKQRPKGRSKR